MCEAGAPIYAAAVAAPGSDPEFGGVLLAELVAASGGRYWELDDWSRLDEAAHRIAAELHEQYVVGYRSPDGGAGGRYRRIAVKVAAPRVSVAFRSGYFAPE